MLLPLNTLLCSNNLHFSVFWQMIKEGENNLLGDKTTKMVVFSKNKLTLEERCYFLSSTSGIALFYKI